MKLSKATRQLTQVPRAPSFRMPPAPTHPHYSTAEQWLCSDNTSQPQIPQRQRVAEEAQGLCPLHHHHRGDHGSVPPQVLKAETKTHEVLRPAVGRFSVQHLDYWRMSLSNPWVLATVSRGYTLQFRHRPVYRNPSDSCQGSDQFNGPVTKNLFTVAGRSQRKSFSHQSEDGQRFLASSGSVPLKCVPKVSSSSYVT